AGTAGPSAEGNSMSFIPRSTLRRSATVAATLGLLAASFASPSAADTPPVTITAGPNFTPLAAPLSTSACQAEFGIRCYSPAQLHTAYDLNSLYRKGITGRGETIVV